MKRWIKHFGGSLAIVATAALVLTAMSVPVLAEENAQTEGWNEEFELGVNMLQSAYSNNWNGGDKGSVVWAANFDALLEKQFGTKGNWRNILKLVYGQTHKQERDANGDNYWAKPDKTDDIVEFESLFRFTSSSGWDPFVALNFNSMFEDISDPGARTLTFNPMKIKESAGISRTLINEENKVLMTRIGVSFSQNSRQFFLNASPDETTTRESSTEIAAEMITEYKTMILEDAIEWESKLALVLPFQYSGKKVFEDELTADDYVTYSLPSDIADYTSMLNVDFSNTFTANITKVISVKLFARWVYEKYDNTVKPVVQDGALINAGAVGQAIRKSGQFKQTLALGFSRKF